MKRRIVTLAAIAAIGTATVTGCATHPDGADGAAVAPRYCTSTLAAAAVVANQGLDVFETLVGHNCNGAQPLVEMSQTTAKLFTGQ